MFINAVKSYTMATIMQKMIRAAGMHAHVIPCVISSGPQTMLISSVDQIDDDDMRAIKELEIGLSALYPRL